LGKKFGVKALSICNSSLERFFRALSRRALSRLRLAIDCLIEMKPIVAEDKRINPIIMYTDVIISSLYRLVIDVVSIMVV